MARARKAGDGAGRPAPSDLPPDRQRDHCREAALKLLGVRERSEQELRDRLRKKGYRPDIVDGVIARLQESGLQSDDRFADRFAESAVARGLGGRRIRTGLLSKGVDRELAVQVTTESPEDEEARARALVQRRLVSMAELTSEARQRRLLGMLARRGFSPEICVRIAREAASDPDPDS
ncbi:MAG TPA: regulatory protein RecX [Actinomycetota bacterium]|nr:regulatory protein RecX [Actinomycetota bacterium]